MFPSLILLNHIIKNNTGTVIENIIPPSGNTLIRIIFFLGVRSYNSMFTIKKILLRCRQVQRPNIYTPCFLDMFSRATVPSNCTGSTVELSEMAPLL